MNKEGELSNAIYDVIKKVTRASAVVDGTIISVDESKFTCNVTINTGNEAPTTFFDVPLRVLVSSQASIIEIPELNTSCIICFRDNNIGRPQILEIHKALKILVICDDIRIDSNSVVFNGGQLGGLVKVNDLVSRLNTIEQDINTLKLAFASWTPTPNDGGAALKTAAGAWYGQQLQPTQASQLENTKIKQ